MPRTDRHPRHQPALRSSPGSSDLQHDTLPSRETDQGDEQDAGHRAPPYGRSGPGQVAGDTADDEDRQHREQRPDTAAIAQRPTARRVARCHRARAGEHEQPDRKARRAERGRPIPRRRTPTPPGDERGREQGQQDRRREDCRGRGRDQQPGPAGGQSRTPGPRALPQVGARPGTVTARQRGGSPHTAAVLPTRRHNVAGPPGTVVAVRWAARRPRSEGEKVEPVEDDRRGTEEADRGNQRAGGAGQTAPEATDDQCLARWLGFAGGEPDQGQRHQTTTSTPMTSDTPATTSSAPQLMGHVFPLQAATPSSSRRPRSTCGGRGGMSLTLSAVTRRRRDTA
jgi:hypothetical protein